MKKILAILALSMCLTACATVKPTPAIIISQAPPVVAPIADPIIPKSVQWHVYTLAELKAAIINMPDNSVLFTLDESNFKNLAGNLVDVKKFIGQQNTIIKFLDEAANAPSQAATPPPIDKK